MRASSGLKGEQIGIVLDPGIRYVKFVTLAMAFDREPRATFRSESLGRYDARRYLAPRTHDPDAAQCAPRSSSSRYALTSQ